MRDKLIAYLGANWKLRSILNKSTFFRKFITNNYKSGCIALGEQNAYNRKAVNYITVDVFNSDVNMNFKKKEKLPFADNSIKIIYSAHMIEHLDMESLDFLISECYRVIDKNEGVIRLQAPDAELLMNAYNSNEHTILDFWAKQYKDLLVDDLGFPSIYGERHVAFIGALSCYMIKGLNCHIPVVASKEEVENNLSKMTLEEFAEWTVSLQTDVQKSTFGHITPIYFDKMNALLTKYGFPNLHKCNPQESNISDIKKLEWLGERTEFSLFVESRFWDNKSE